MMRAVFQRSRARGNARLVLLAIASYANDEGKAWPGIDTLSQDTNLTRRSVIRSFKPLVQLKELTIVRQTRRPNLYYIHLPSSRPQNDRAQPTRKGDISGQTDEPTDVAPKGDISGQNGVTPLSPESSEEIIKESDDSPQPVREEDSGSPTPFDRFFDTMPARNGSIKQYKERTRLLFQALSEDEQELCIKAAQQYRKVCRDSDQYPRDPYRYVALRVSEGNRG
jgi:hypothetical protein